MASPSTPLSANPLASTKRTDYLLWPDYFMATAFLAAQRSKDPSTQVGAVIVDARRRIVGVGYNGFPHGCSDDEFPWTKPPPATTDLDDAAAADPLQHKFMYVCHAEVNAVLNKNAADVSGCTMYVALFPCNECAKIIIQSGIRELVYLSDKHAHKPQTKAAKRMFEAAEVRCTRYEPDRRRITIDFGVADDDESLLSFVGLRLNSGGDKTPPTTPQSPPSPVVTPSFGGRGKRTDYLTWPEYFMAMCLLSAQRSKDPSTQVGACIVNAANKIVGVGYNGLPNGCHDDQFPWTRPAVATPDGGVSDNKYLYVCHAEVNAILNRNGTDVTACTIYVALFPCNECAKMIIQSGIRRVVYLSDKYAHTAGTVAAKRMFAAVGVQCYRFESTNTGSSSRSQVVIDFDDIERRSYSQLPATPGGGMA